MRKLAVMTLNAPVSSGPRMRATMIETRPPSTAIAICATVTRDAPRPAVAARQARQARAQILDAAIAATRREWRHESNRNGTRGADPAGAASFRDERGFFQECFRD